MDIKEGGLSQDEALYLTNLTITWEYIKIFMKWYGAFC